MLWGVIMKLDQSVYFPPFRLDPRDACLWHGAERVTLIPKDFALLAYLATHPQRLVSYEELLYAVWGDTVVSHGVFKVHLCRIRRALHDSAMSPRFIETVPRQGYRFIAPVATEQAPVALRQDRPQDFSSVFQELQSALTLVDLDENAAQLKAWVDDFIHKVRSLASTPQHQLPHAA